MYKKTVLFTAVLLWNTGAYAGTVDGNAVLGSMIGAAAGSASGGQEGAIIGGGVGGALGAALTSRSSGRVIAVEGYHDHGRSPGRYRYRNGHSRNY